MNDLIIYNKRVLTANSPCISPHDRGLTLGHGLFETIFVNKHSFPAFDYHWQRLEASAPLVGIKLPFSQNELESMLSELLVANKLHNRRAGARLTLTHGEAERGLLPLKTPTPNFLITVFAHDLVPNPSYSAMIVNTRKNEYSVSSKVKSISYLDNILAKQEARQQGYDEAILLNSQGKVADGSFTTIYIVKNKQIFTPPVSDGALPGVIRSILMREFQQQVAIIEQSISVAELLAADEVFLSNALMGIQPLTQLNDKKLFSFSKANQIKSLLRTEKNISA